MFIPVLIVILWALTQKKKSQNTSMYIKVVSKKRKRVYAVHRLMVYIKSRKPLQRFEWKFNERCRKPFPKMCREQNFEKNNNTIFMLKNTILSISCMKNIVYLFF